MTKKKKKDRRLEFLSIIPKSTRKLLDVGCEYGDLSGNLRRRGIEVIGVDRDENVCAKAREKLDDVIVADIETAKLPFPKGYFDCIMYADVLNCLIDPLSLLKRHRDYLNDNGYVVASMPNIRFYKVIIRLVLFGTWDYVEEGGILWKYHLRFFTLINIKELFMEAGYEIVEIKRYIVASRAFKIINFLLLDKLKDFLTYQYYIKARKVKDSSSSTFQRKRKIYRF